MKDSLAPRTAFQVPYSGSLGNVLRLHVTARRPVNVYVMDAEMVSKYERDGIRDIIPLAGRKDRCEHLLVVGPDPGTRVWLVIENPSQEETVEFEYVVEEVSMPQLSIGQGR